MQHRRGPPEHSECFHPRSRSVIDHSEWSDPPYPCTILNSECSATRTPCYKNIIEFQNPRGPRGFSRFNLEKLRRHCVPDHSEWSRTQAYGVFDHSEWSRTQGYGVLDHSECSWAQGYGAFDHSECSWAQGVVLCQFTGLCSHLGAGFCSMMQPVDLQEHAAT